MSRHTIPALRPEFTVIVGWDNPLAIYYAQVSRDDAGEDDDPVVLWLGTEANQITSPWDLIEPLIRYVTLRVDTIEQLRSDRAACLDRSPSALQRASLNFLGRVR